MDKYSYAGQELELFARALHWKKYWAAQVRPYLRGAVLEVGAGIGSNTPLLCNPECSEWVCLEPDEKLARQIQATLAQHTLAGRCQVVIGTTESLRPAPAFDAIVYIDILEHLQDDRAEMGRAAARLQPGGWLIVLSPAHQWLFSPFDAAIGHVRRYNRAGLERLGSGLTLERMAYLDSVGLLASAANRLLLKAALPGPRQIKLWDGLMVPLSRLVDPCLLYRVGKSILAIWRK